VPPGRGDLFRSGAFDGAAAGRAAAVDHDVGQWNCSIAQIDAD